MPKRTLIFIIGLMLPMIVPILADDEPAIKFPARDTFREVSDQWNTTPDIPGRHIQITVTPAELPYPLLKYRLNTYVTEMESGNAAPLYSEAYWVLKQTQENLLRWKVYETTDYAKLQWPGLIGGERPKSDEIRITADKLKFKAFPIPAWWSRDAWTEIDAADEEQLYNDYLKQVYHIIEKAGRKRDCDWGYITEYKGIATLLPHVQNARDLARFLQGKANWEIRNGKYDDAVKTIRLGLRLSEHLKNSDFPVLVTELVGIAIRGIMESEIRLLSAQPDAPNLYPALTQIIEPGDLFQKSLQAEQYWLFSRQNVQEVFERIDTATDTEYMMLLDDILSTMMSAQRADYGDVKDKFKTANMKTMACIVCYPYGKARLLKQGFSDEEIESMSVYRVVVPHILEEIKAAYDKLIVASSFPVGSQHAAIVFDSNDYMNISESPARIYLAMLLPAVEAAKNAFLRQEQGLDLLKIVEAIRYYAAVHEGQLPESLEAIGELYVPLVNPMDNKPYVYRTEGNTAFIEFNSPNSGGKSRLDVTIEGLGTRD